MSLAMMAGSKAKSKIADKIAEIARNTCQNYLYAVNYLLSLFQNPVSFGQVLRKTGQIGLKSGRFFC